MIQMLALQNNVSSVRSSVMDQEMMTSGVLFTIMCIRTQTILSYASSTTFIRAIHYQFIRFVLCTCNPLLSYSIYGTIRLLKWACAARSLNSPCILSIYFNNSFLKYANLTTWWLVMTILLSFSHLNVLFLQWQNIFKEQSYITWCLIFFNLNSDVI